MPAPEPKYTIGAFYLTFYRRRVSRSEATLPVRDQVITTVMGLLAEQGSVSTTEVMRHCGRSRGTVIKYINELLSLGDLETMERAGSTRQRYRLPKR